MRLDPSVAVMAGNQGPGAASYHQPHQQLSPADFRLMFYEQDPDQIHETEVLSGIVRRQSKYGSTSIHTNHFPNQKFISHMVQPNDTLQGLSRLSHCHRHPDSSFSLFSGLALRYSVTVSMMTRFFRSITDMTRACRRSRSYVRIGCTRLTPCSASQCSASRSQLTTRPPLTPISSLILSGTTRLPPAGKLRSKDKSIVRKVVTVRAAERKSQEQKSATRLTPGPRPCK